MAKGVGKVACWMALVGASASAFAPLLRVPVHFRPRIAPLRASKSRRLCLGMSGAGAERGDVVVQAKKSVLFDEFCSTLPRMDGKVVAITGCTSGIGFIVARTVLDLGAIVVMLNRPSIRAEAACVALRSGIDFVLPQLAAEQAMDLEAQVAQQMNEMRVVPIDCDLLDFASVKQAYVEIRTKFPDGIDVLCLNGGIGAAPPNHVRSVGSYEPMMQTNHLSHFLLTQLLLPSMEARAASLGSDTRIVSVTSEARTQPNTPLAAAALAMQTEEDTFDSRWARAALADELYHQSKLAVAIFALEQHRRLRQQSSRVKSLLAHPGLCTTGAALDMFATIFRDKPDIAAQVAAFVDSQAQSEEDGAIGLLTCICLPEANSGDFYGPRGMNGRVDRLTPEELLMDPDAAATLWRASQAATAPFTSRPAS